MVRRSPSSLSAWHMEARQAAEMEPSQQLEGCHPSYVQIRTPPWKVSPAQVQEGWAISRPLHHVSLWGDTAGTAWLGLPLIPPPYSAVWENY